MGNDQDDPRALAGGFFVGREVEVGLLRALVTGVASGTGGAVLVEGEQGIGKTTLMREGLAGASGAGCQVGWAAADELARDLPLGLMMECLRAGGWSVRWDDARSGGSLLPTANPVAATAERLLAFVDRLCADGPVVLVAEDLHIADESSLVLWQRLAKATAQMPLLVAGSCRPTPGSDVIAKLRKDLLAEGGEVIGLGTLSAADVRDLAGRLAGGKPGPRLAELADRSGGNPLYLTELVDAVTREAGVRVTDGVADLTSDEHLGVPESLAAAIGDRLGALGDETLRVLRWGAVLGSCFFALDLETVTGLTREELERAMTEAVEAGLVISTEQVSFRHGLIRQAIYESMPTSARSALHLTAARAMAEAGGLAERVAAHLAAVPDIAQRWVPDWIARVAPSLTGRAPELTSDLLRRALAELADDDPRRTDLEAGLLTAMFLLGCYSEAEHIARGALAGAEDPDQATEIARQLAYTLLRTGRAADGAAITAEMLTRRDLGEVSRARLEAMHAMLLAALGRLDEAAETADGALTRAELAGDRYCTGFALHVRSTICYVRADHGARTTYIERALAAIGDEPSAVSLRITLLSNLSASLAGMERWSEALAAAERAVIAAERAGYPSVSARAHLAMLYFETGRWDDALSECELIADLPTAVSLQFAVHGLIALIAAHRDDADAAGRHLAFLESLPLDDLACRSNACDLLVAKAVATERAGQTISAVTTLVQILDPDWKDVVGLNLEHLPMLVRLALAVGDVATAAAAITALEAAIGTPETAYSGQLPSHTAVAGHCRGLVNADPEPVLAAATYYQSAGLVHKHAVALEDAAVLLARAGEFDAARSAFAEAISRYETLRATWDARRAATRLRSLGIRRGHRPSPRSHPVAGWESLTPTETRIAYLVAQGRSNPDIAAELMLSRSTVHTHVSHILAKLAARSRAAIIREALGHPQWQIARG